MERETKRKRGEWMRCGKEVVREDVRWGDGCIFNGTAAIKGGYRKGRLLHAKTTASKTSFVSTGTRKVPPPLLAIVPWR